MDLIDLNNLYIRNRIFFKILVTILILAIIIILLQDKDHLRLR